MRFPPKILAVISNPKDLEEIHNLSSIDVAVERDLLEGVFADQPLCLDILEPPVTLARLEAKLREGYQILHYIGHNALLKMRGGEPALFFQKQDGISDLVRTRDFAAMLARQGMQPHLVVLMTCKSATASVKRNLPALGPQLIDYDIPWVVAMQGQIAQSSARSFTREFYKRLINHGFVDLAMNEARSTLVTEGHCDASVPVLFMGLRDGCLWCRADKSSRSEQSASSSDDRSLQRIVIHGDGNVIGNHSSSQVTKR